MSVIVHHLNAAWLPGGFVGVDIFFVISGFLITSQIHGEIQRGTFEIRAFYQRRISRIVPALVAVVAVTLLAGFVFVSPADLSLLATSALAAMTGVSNVYFWQTYGNYFSGNTSEALLLQTWSLGVEEQFYVVWPLALLVLGRIGPRWRFATGGAVVVLAAAVSEYGANQFVSASYFLLPTRFFEIAIGGLVALVAHRAGGLAARWNPALSLVGFSLIAGSLFLLSRSSSLPGLNALWPCLGGAILLWCGLSANAVSSRILSTPLLPAVGLLSYSLYLWHWPIIALIRYLNIPVDGSVAAAVLATTFPLAWATWRYIEVPCRRNGVNRAFKSVVLWRLVTPIVVVGLVAVVARVFSGFPGRFDHQAAVLENMNASRPSELRAGCHVPTSRYLVGPSEACRLGASRAKADAILVGDSYANHFSGMIDVLAREADLTVLDYTMDGCPPIEGYLAPPYRENATKCRARNEFVYEHLWQVRYRYVILAAHWPEDADAGPLLERSVARAIGSGAQVIVVLANPTIPNGATCPVRAIMYRRAGDCGVRRARPPGYFASLRLSFPSVQFIDPSEVVCPGGWCRPVLDGRLLYLDDGHLNDGGSRLIGERLIAGGFRFAASDERRAASEPPAGSAPDHVEPQRTRGRRSDNGLGWP